MKTLNAIFPSTGPHSQLAREIARERNQRQKNEEQKAGIGAEDELRVKDARDNLQAGPLHRAR